MRDKTAIIAKHLWPITEQSQCWAAMKQSLIITPAQKQDMSILEEIIGTHPEISWLRNWHKCLFFQMTP